MSDGQALRVLVVDDEGPARLRLTQLLARCEAPKADCVAQAADAESALQAARGQGLDLALLDIALPGRSGLQLAAELKAELPGLALVFVTAHSQHAVHAFELEAVDYLTKPVRLERLQQTLRRVAQRRLSAAPAGPQPATLRVQQRGRLLRIPVDEVLYLRAELKYVTLRTARDEYVLDEPLGDLALRLGPGFVRIHRNALVALRAVRSLQRGADQAREGEAWAVYLPAVDESLPVSRRLLPGVKAALLARSE